MYLKFQMKVINRKQKLKNEKITVLQILMKNTTTIKDITVSIYLNIIYKKHKIYFFFKKLSLIYADLFYLIPIYLFINLI